MTDKITHEEHGVRVRSYELDSYAHVNNGAYLSWFEDARECFLRRAGLDYAYFPEVLGLHIVVVNINADFMRAAKAGEEVLVRTRLGKIGKKSVAFRQTARAADGAIFARARTVMAFSDVNERSAACPPLMAERFLCAEGEDRWQDDEGGERA